VRLDHTDHMFSTAFTTSPPACVIRVSINVSERLLFRKGGMHTIRGGLRPCEHRELKKNPQYQVTGHQNMAPTIKKLSVYTRPV
jgi:hypothetical protein